MKFWLPLFLLLCFIGVWACKTNTNPVTPSISFISLYPDSVHSGSFKDTAYLSFGFTDGDGDLGNDPTSGNYDVFLKDTRDTGTNFSILRYFFPPIPDGARDPIKGLEGKGTIAIQGIYINTRQDTLHRLHGDTVSWRMWVKDRAGHTSDTIQTTSLIILP
ncbi:MAG: hypothetical protein JST06_11840 [Bacteroidetes bacterium]|nr:hypothetical protein [Bacteroidota bacterium]MBS1630866.1 hypothetical protein [Bacteroidota bacterium]